MAIDSGLVEYLDWGTTTTIATSVGKVTGGAITPGDSAAVHREAIGAQDKVTGGPIPVGGNATFQVANYDLLTYAVRSAFTAPTLTEVCLAGGVVGYGRKQTGCKINTLELSCAIGEPLTANMSWLGLTDEADATAAKSYLSDVVFEWFMAATLINSAAVQCTGFTLTINNNLEHVWTLDTSTAASRRLPDAIRIGSQQVALSVDVLTRPDATAYTDILADTLAVDIPALFTFSDGGASAGEDFTITLSQLSRFTAPIPLVVGGGMVTYTQTFEAPNDTSCISITCAA